MKNPTSRASSAARAQPELLPRGQALLCTLPDTLTVHGGQGTCLAPTQPCANVAPLQVIPYLCNDLTERVGPNQTCCAALGSAHSVLLHACAGRYVLNAGAPAALAVLRVLFTERNISGLFDGQGLDSA